MGESSRTVRSQIGTTITIILMSSDTGRNMTTGTDRTLRPDAGMKRRLLMIIILQHAGAVSSGLWIIITRTFAMQLVSFTKKSLKNVDSAVLTVVSSRTDTLGVFPAFPAAAFGFALPCRPPKQT